MTEKRELEDNVYRAVNRAKVALDHSSEALQKHRRYYPPSELSIAVEALAESLKEILAAMMSELPPEDTDDANVRDQRP